VSAFLVDKREDRHHHRSFPSFLNQLYPNDERVGSTFYVVVKQKKGAAA
jgi:hypothetical protein